MTVQNILRQASSMPRLDFWHERGLTHNRQLAGVLRSLGRNQQANRVQRCQSIIKLTGGPAIRFSCHEPLCYFCTNQRRCRLDFIWGRAVSDLIHPLFLTLTLRDSRYLAGVRSRMVSDFLRLRRRRYFKDRCHGGFFCCEFDFNPYRDVFHPHLHTLIDGVDISQAWLSRAWKDLTSAYVVHKREIAKDGVQKVFFYLLKAPCRSLEPRAVSEVYHALGHAPLFRAFGAMTPRRGLCPQCRQKTQIRFDEVCRHHELSRYLGLEVPGICNE